jgi:altronate hydrolase
MQDMGGTLKTVEEGVRQLAALLPQANDVRREPIPASEIILGTECGGSDGNSGVTANPALGVASDMLVACGGTVILSETPEIYGAEHLAHAARQDSRGGRKLLERIEWWKWYTGVFGAEMDNNPSVGNKEGGLTTIAEKSLGAVAKGGSTALVDVYQYAEPVTGKGFRGDGHARLRPAQRHRDGGRGGERGGLHHRPGKLLRLQAGPVDQVATNTPMYERMIDDMDLNAGEILDGTAEDRRRRWPSRSSRRSWPSPAARRPRASSTAWATRSSSPGRDRADAVAWRLGPRNWRPTMCAGGECEPCFSSTKA